MNPSFLDFDQVLALHEELIERYGGASGVRDPGMLHSALAMPQGGVGGEFYHADVFEMAVVYLFHVVKNHPFLDGNKRTGAAAAIVFLALNDISIAGDEDGLVKLTLNVAMGKGDKREIAEFFRRRAE